MKTIGYWKGIEFNYDGETFGCVGVGQRFETFMDAMECAEASQKLTDLLEKIATK